MTSSAVVSSLPCEIVDVDTRWSKPTFDDLTAYEGLSILIFPKRRVHRVTLGLTIIVLCIFVKGGAGFGVHLLVLYSTEVSARGSLSPWPMMHDVQFVLAFFLFTFQSQRHNAVPYSMHHSYI